MLRIVIISILYFIIFCGPVPGNAGTRIPDHPEDMAVRKAKIKAAKAGIRDWKTLAGCAGILLSKGISTDEVLSWIERSIALRESSYNLGLLGDFYRAKLDFARSKDCYLRALMLAQSENDNEAIRSIQLKLLITLGTEKYYLSIGLPPDDISINESYSK
jgi:hypothetical protein